MLTDYQIGRIRQFTDSVRAGATEHPEQVLLELADLMDDLMADELRLQLFNQRCYDAAVQATRITMDTPPGAISAEEWNRAADKRLIP